MIFWKQSIYKVESLSVVVVVILKLQYMYVCMYDVASVCVLRRSVGRRHAIGTSILQYVYSTRAHAAAKRPGTVLDKFIPSPHTSLFFGLW